MFVLIAFDISDDKKRRLLSKSLKTYGTWVQRSLFEMFVEGSDLGMIIGIIDEIIDHETDKVKIYTFCERCRENKDLIGWGECIEESDEVLIL